MSNQHEETSLSVTLTAGEWDAVVEYLNGAIEEYGDVENSHLVDKITNQLSAADPSEE